MALILSDALRQDIIGHARAESPAEACGILAGRDNRVHRIFRVRNAADEVGPERDVFRERQTGQAAAGRRAVHYYMDPKDQLRVYNEIDALGLDVLGYYHSHTHTEARPSPTDIRLATDLTTYYMLVSLANAPAVRAWKIAKADPMDESGEAIEIPIMSDASTQSSVLSPQS